MVVKMKTLYLVIPCYNEEAVINETAKRLDVKLDKMIQSKIITCDSKMVFVDDGSRDKTWDLIEKLKTENGKIQGIKLTHNRGHQNALIAGLMTCKDDCDCIISLDADLQDDIEVLDEFVYKYNEGCEVVYGVRKDRQTDSFFKKSTAKGFYKLMKMLGVEIVDDHADYRLLGKEALKAIAEYKEVNLFLRGIIPLIGYRSDYVYYIRNERFAGESKYPVKKMIEFALEGVSSFSVKPLKLISSLGIFISLLSIIGLLYALISYITGNVVVGWTAIVASIWLLGGIQMLCIGVLGTYIGKIYSEVKARPRFRVEKHLK